MAFDAIQLDTSYSGSAAALRYYRQSDGQAWNTTINGGLGGWEADNDANYSEYLIAIPNVGASGRTGILRPSGIGTEPVAIVGIIVIDGTLANDLVVWEADEPIKTNPAGQVETSNPGGLTTDQEAKVDKILDLAQT